MNCRLTHKEKTHNRGRNLRIIILFLILPLFSFAQIKNVSFWERGFVKKANKNYDFAKSLSTSGDTRKFYDLAYYIDANVAMYKATANTGYLENAIEYVNDMMASAVPSKQLFKSQYKDSFSGWGNYNIPNQKNIGREIPLYESYVWRYVTDILLVMKENGLNEDEEFKFIYDRIYIFTLENIYNKWYSRGEENLYRSNTHMTSHWVKISMNLFLITGNQKYKPIIDNFIFRFNQNLESFCSIRELEIFKWKSDWRNREKDMHQDVSHGNAVIDVLIALYENDMGVSKEEIDQLIELFDKTIWKSKNSYAKYIDGSDTGSGWFTDGFIKLGRYSEDLQKRIEKHNKGRSVQFFANGALNAKFLISNEK